MLQARCDLVAAPRSALSAVQGVDPTVVSPGAIWWRDSLGTSGGGCSHITVQGRFAFAFCRLLGFLLLSRLKAIHSQKLYRPETGKADAYANLQLILSKPIDWDLVRQQYLRTDDQVRHGATPGDG
jgi:hypothetical protein